MHCHRNPRNPVTVIQQKARSLELQAALALARLYRSNNRPSDAPAVLSPALKEFSQSPELPETEEAHNVLQALANGVKTAATVRSLRLRPALSFTDAAP